MNLLATFEQILSPGAVLTQGLEAYERDWRGRGQGRALCVLRPQTTQEVAAIVKACAAARAQGQAVSLVPQGGNTGLAMGSTPDDSGQQVVLSLQRMNRVRQLDAANLAITVEAGCVLQAVQEAAQAEALLFPLSLAAQGSCTIGGNLATNAGGTQVLRYGNTRDLCLGLEVVTAQGEVWQGLSGLRKDNTGYDLRHLMIGSEGTLGIITAATMKLYPQPAATLTAWAALPSLEAAQEFLALAQQRLASSLTGFEVMGQPAVALVAQHFASLKVPLWPGLSQQLAYSALLEISDAQDEGHAHEQLQALLEQALSRELIADAVLAQTGAQAQAMWQIRESIPLAQAKEGLNIKHDISLPISVIPQFVAQTQAQLQSGWPGVRLVNFGHLGDGNLHFNVQCPLGQQPSVFLQEQEKNINALVYANVAQFGGSISAEHGIGSLKRDELVHYKSPVALQMMRSIKAALDPLGLLNPGRVV